MKCFQIRNMFVLRTFTDGWVVTRHDEFISTKDMLADGLHSQWYVAAGME
jgi:hypothetical protein